MLELYDNIKKIRESLNLSQEQLAERTGYTSRSSIAKIEKGLVDLPLSKIETFAAALGTTPGELMGNTWDYDYEPDTIAAHHDGDSWTDEELAEIEEFKKYVKSKRK